MGDVGEELRLCLVERAEFARLLLDELFVGLNPSGAVLYRLRDAEGGSVDFGGRRNIKKKNLKGGKNKRKRRRELTYFVGNREDSM